MNLNQISAWSIRNPVVPIVLFLGLTLTGRSGNVAARALFLFLSPYGERRISSAP